MTVVPRLLEQVDHSLWPAENSKVCDLAQSFRPDLASKPRAIGSAAHDKRAAH
jgi:hypothetical protein